MASSPRGRCARRHRRCVQRRRRQRGDHLCRRHDHRGRHRARHDARHDRPRPPPSRPPPSPPPRSNRLRGGSAWSPPPTACAATAASSPSSSARPTRRRCCSSWRAAARASPPRPATRPAPTYKRERRYGDDFGESQPHGIFDFANPMNPFADFSVVYVPYCTGDVHIGNTDHDYGDGVVIEHKGYVNGTTALDHHCASCSPTPPSWWSPARAPARCPSPLYAGLARDLLPDARITVLADGSGAYPDIPGINAVIGGVWGTMNAVPDWPENAGVTAETWSFPGLFVKAGTHDPDITFARHDYAFDETQTFFAGPRRHPRRRPRLADRPERGADRGRRRRRCSATSRPGDSHTVLGKRRVLHARPSNGVTARRLGHRTGRRRAGRRRALHRVHRAD